MAGTAAVRKAKLDVRTLGRAPLLLVGAAGALCLAAVGWGHAVYSPATAGRVLGGCIEELPAVACGLASVGVLAGDRALEIQATARRPLAWLACSRMAAILALTLTIAGLTCGLAALLDVKAPRGAPAELALTVIAPTLFLVGLAFVASVAMRGATPAGALILALAAAENIANGPLSSGPLRQVFLFSTTYTPHASGWASNRLVLLLCALALIALGAVAVNRPGAALDLAHGDAA